MPLSMQVGLLRVIQEGAVLRVGGRKPIPVNVRIVAATADSLKAAIEEGIFRRDFYHRVNAVSLHVPSLHEHREDILPLAHHILNRINLTAAKPVTAISADAMQLLSGYAYPGNLRELENIIQQAAAVCRGSVIRVADLPPDLDDALENIHLARANFIHNAADASREGGTVRVIALPAEKPNHIAVKIIDNGSGIAPHILPSIFDAFFTTKEKGRGTGLGLSVSQVIIAKHGGNIQVESKLGSGSVFTVNLPVTTFPREVSTL